MHHASVSFCARFVERTLFALDDSAAVHDQVMRVMGEMWSAG